MDQIAHDSVLGSIGRFSVRFPVPILCFWLIAAFLTVYFLPSLSSVTQNLQNEVLPSSAASVQAAGLDAPFQNPEVITGTIVAVTKGGPLTSEDLTDFSTLEAQVRQLHGIAGVVDEGVSGDKQARIAEIQSDEQVLDRGNTETLLVGEIRSLFGPIRRITGMQVHLSGSIADFVDQNGSNSRAEGRTEILSIVFIVVLLLLVFRSLLAPLIALIPAALALAIASPVIAKLSSVGLPVSDFTDFILIVVVLGAGTDYGLFLVFRVREEMSHGLEPKEAVTRSVTRVGQSIVFSALTVMTAFASLLLATFGVYRGIGPDLAIAIGVVAIMDLTLLPALLSLLGKAVFWPAIPAQGSRAEGIWGRIATRIVARPLQTLIGGVVIFGVLSAFGLGYSPAGFNGSDIAPPGSDSALGAAALAAHFPEAETNPTYVVFRFVAPVWLVPGVLEQAAQLIGQDQQFKAVAGPLDPNGTVLSYEQLMYLHRQLGAAKLLTVVPPDGTRVPIAQYEAYRATDEFISTDGSTVRFDTTLSAGEPDSDGALSSVPAIRSSVDRIGDELGAVVSAVAGDAPIYYDEVHISDQDLVRLIPVVLVLIALLLGLQLRSVLAPVYLVASVLLSYLAMLGLAVLVFDVVGGGHGVNFILPVLGFMFLMALGEDYNILLMSRVKEELRGASLTAAVRSAVGATGTTITSAGLILAGTFVVLSISTTGAIREIGIGVAAGILLDTFVVRTLLVPSTIVLLGRLNWWPSKPPDG
jgi:RND superfamily putative drug exporter